MMRATRSPPLNINGKRAADDLDLIRGLAAIAVLIYHIRYRFFYDYADMHNADWFSKVFYGMTSFGHDAVIVFFVLSGYFISASVLRDGAKVRWSWTRYAINRLTRLYLVLLPGLLLTVFWDRLGLRYFPDHHIYTGAPQPWINDFSPVVKRLGVGTFAANAFFLQTVLAPPLGSNEALWSLSNEFWYYVLFPLTWFALVWRTSWVKSLGGLALGGLLLVFVGKQIAIYFPIWLLGTAACVAPVIRVWNRPHSWLSTGIALATFCTVLVATHLSIFKRALGDSQAAVDYLNGLVFAVVLYFIIHNQSSTADGAYAIWSRALAGFSYTLYIVHLPLLVFLRAALVPEAAWQCDWRNCSLAVGIMLGSLVYAYLISRLTEARTDTVRGYILQRLTSAKT
jgi:peptidoglycan/LPS O-acetylase OafA/YrhL